MHDTRLRDEARSRFQRGVGITEIALELDVPRTTVHRWVSRELLTDRVPPVPCPRCRSVGSDTDQDHAYAYLLGQYLGDGHLVTAARVPVLRIYACTDYPHVLHEIERSVDVVRGREPGLVRWRSTDRMVSVQSYWMHWPCLFPQHGPGRKHERPIVLADWQQKIVDEHPWPLIRGLIHSDGCRSRNRVVVRGKAYAYWRYLFSNESGDILSLMGGALDRVGVEWRYNRPNSISVARRASVAIMDEHVGPKT